MTWVRARTLDVALPGDVPLYHIEKHEWGPWSCGTRKSFQLGFVRQNLSSSVDTPKVQALVLVFWSQMCDFVVLAVDYQTAMYQVMNNWNRKTFLVIDGERQRLRNISISGCMRVCSYLWKFSCYLWHCCRRMCWLALRVLWRIPCYSQNTVAKAQQPIVISHCLHMPSSQKHNAVFTLACELDMAIKTCLCICIHVEIQIGSYTWLN